ncbi:MAG: DMT family transporter [Candidatus Eremiobacteraeota bacterium]|nr:DMT family transporter [Candidatus Eremiobacteraeota bacterium]MCW5869846.1 DMT family transporter [Candidatus Eremiobacteraeota bacterium]
MDYLALALAVVLKACGDALLGRAMNDEKRLSPWQAWLRILKNPGLLLGVIVTALHFGLYAYCLQRLPVTLANPLTALTIVIGTFYAQWGLGERVNRRRWGGIVLVTSGAMLVSLS